MVFGQGECAQPKKHK